MRVVVVDDNDVWRASLVTALISRGITVVAEAAGGAEVLAALDAAGHPPVDVAILDLRLPPTWSDEGIHLASWLRRRMSRVGIMILSGYEHDVQLHYATRALHDLGGGGGVGYLFKDRASRGSLRDAVHRIARGRVMVDPIFSRLAVEAYRNGSDDAAVTDREIEVLTLMLRGLTSAEIADSISLKVDTVEADLARISRRVGGNGDAAAGPDGPDGRQVVAVLDWLRRSGG